MSVYLEIRLRCCGALLMSEQRLDIGLDEDYRSTWTITTGGTVTLAGMIWRDCCPSCWHARPVGVMR